MNLSPDLATLGFAIRDTLPVLAGVFLALLVTLGPDLSVATSQPTAPTLSADTREPGVLEEIWTDLSPPPEVVDETKARCHLKADGRSRSVSQPHNIVRPRQNAPRADA